MSRNQKSLLKSLLRRNGNHPHVSLYLRPARPSVPESSPARRLEALLAKADHSLKRFYPSQADSALAALRARAATFTPEQLEKGVALFHCDGTTWSDTSYHPREDLSFVADSFHIRPLLEDASNSVASLAVVFSGNRTRVLRVRAGEATLLREFHHDRASLASRVERAVLEIKTAARKDASVAIVASVRQGAVIRKLFRRCGISSWMLPPSDGQTELPENLLGATISSALTERETGLLKAGIASRLRAAISETTARGPRALSEILKLAASGQLKELFLAKGIRVWALSEIPTAAPMDDVLDDAAEEVLRHGGLVVTVPARALPRGMPAVGSLRTTSKAS